MSSPQKTFLKKLRPDEKEVSIELHKKVVEQALFILKKQPRLPIQDLAKELKLSLFHFQRIFKKWTGTTPKQFSLTQQVEQAKHHLKEQATVTKSIYESGYESTGRFYESLKTRLGVTPRIYQQQGAGTPLFFTVEPCQYGKILIAGTERGLCSLRLGSSKPELVKELKLEFAKARFEKPSLLFRRWVSQILKHLEEPGPELNLPLDVRGSLFQHQVWEALRKIPLGQTATYESIAQVLGKPTAARAVAKACATNPVAIVVPCHRVIRKNGELSDYRWGVATKKRLLQNEGALPHQS